MIPVRWEDDWIERLVWAGRENCVVTRLPGHKTARLEVYGQTASSLRKLQHAFGGKVVRRRPAAWMASQHRHFYLPLPPYLCLASESSAVPVSHRQLPRLIIPAGIAFGTGEHATTAMCLRRLLRHLPERPGNVLDAGTGSGILALAAGLLGHRVTGVDFDPDSIRVARENAAGNKRVPQVRWVCSDILRFKPDGKFDLIVANLFSDLLEKTLPRFRHWLKGEGRLIVSGVLRDQEATVTNALKKNGFVVQERFRKGKWICLVA